MILDIAQTRDIITLAAMFACLFLWAYSQVPE